MPCLFYRSYRTIRPGLKQEGTGKPSFSEFTTVLSSLTKVSVTECGCSRFESSSVGQGGRCYDCLIALPTEYNLEQSLGTRDEKVAFDPVTFKRPMQRIAVCEAWLRCAGTNTGFCVRSELQKVELIWLDAWRTAG